MRFAEEPSLHEARGRIIITMTPKRQSCRLLLVGERDDEHIVAHRGIAESLRLAGERGIDVSAHWPGTREIQRRGATYLDEFDAIWCVPGSPYASMTGALEAIRFARQQRRPFLGTCGGFQHAVIEYARNVAGIRDAEHEESSPDASALVIGRLACSLVEESGRVRLAPGSLARRLAGQDVLTEQYHCSFGFNPEYRAALESAGLTVSGEDEAGDVRVVELPEHPFFLATLFQPERTALRGVLHPFVLAFVLATRSRFSARTPPNRIAAGS